MINPAYKDVAKYAGSVGLLVDRCVRREQPFGTVWLVDEDTVATCAHLVVLYEEFLRGIKVHFPDTGLDWEVLEAKFHPKFDRKLAVDLAQRSLSSAVPALALQDNNLVLLKIGRNVQELAPDDATTFNKKISLAPLPRVKGLVGAVDELGLALVIQTMTNSRKDGILFITDERNRPVARLFCREGKVLYAKFGKLINEMAFYQMFSQDVSGQFNFRTQSKPDWDVTVAMDRPTDGLLLEAHRRIDEIASLNEHLGGRSATYTRVSEVLDRAKVDPAFLIYAERLWPFLDGGVSIDQLWDIVHLDDYSVLSTVNEMYRAGVIAPVPQVDNGLNQMQGLEMAAYQLLSPWDEIVSLTVHPDDGRAQMRRGNLVGLLRPNDPYHLLHTLNLPYNAAGSPLFKNGQVIGMHCGMLPLDPALHALPAHLHQLLWVDAVQQCMDGASSNGGATKKTTGTRKKSIGMQRKPVTLQPGEPERVSCPKCNALMIKEARFCGTCGSKLGAVKNA